MESRLAATARANLRLLSGVFCHQSLRQGLAVLLLPTRRVADPAVHSESLGETDPVFVAEVAYKAEKQQKEHKPTKETDPFVPHNPPVSPSPKLKSPAVEVPVDPTASHQKRRLCAAPNKTPPSYDFSCTALDGGPWPDEREDTRRQVREEEEDHKDYYRHHKASPLSEIEVVDTRKPIRRATDGTADSNVEEFLDDVLWREEQLDTAEEALRRAMEIWRQSAMRGDPDSPHGRVLRALRGEDW